MANHQQVTNSDVTFDKPGIMNVTHHKHVDDFEVTGGSSAVAPVQCGCASLGAGRGHAQQRGNVRGVLAPKLRGNPAEGAGYVDVATSGWCSWLAQDGWNKLGWVDANHTPAQVRHWVHFGQTSLRNMKSDMGYA